MRKLQTQGCCHHITLVGADRQTSIDFWEGWLGTPFVFEQPNLDRPAESHLYFQDPLGLLVELASYRFEPPAGHTHAGVLLEAHRIRVARDDHHIDRVHLADAIEALVTRSHDSLSDDRSPKAAYR